MSGFTDTFRGQAQGGWRAAGSWMTKYGKWQDERRQRTIGQKAGSGCLGFLLFGFVYFFIPIIVVLGVEIVIVAWAVLATALWGLGATVDAVSGRRGRPGQAVAVSGPSPSINASIAKSDTESVANGACPSCGYVNESSPRRCTKCATPL